MVTAGGIFLGIAFLATVLTQMLMQWPIPPKVDPGYVQLDGQINGPGMQEVYKPVPVDVGKQAGIPDAVIQRTLLPDKTRFSLTGVVTGKLQEKRAIKNRARVNREWKGLKPLEKNLPVYVNILGALDIKVADAVKAGIPTKLAEQAAAASGVFKGAQAADYLRKHPRLSRGHPKLCASILAGKDVKVEDAVRAGIPRTLAENAAHKYPTFKGAVMVDLLREQSNGIKPIYVAAALDQDISLSDAARGGVPPAIARLLAASGNAFKGTALNDAIKIHPTWMRIWASRVKRYAIFNQAKPDAVNKLARHYAITLDEALALGKNPDMRSADIGSVMIVNTNGRKIAANLIAHKSIGNTKLASGDYILIPDRNSKYRMFWLVVMSLLVCTVGISNSMLMAVTERFKEIGTMKCLGALDSFVVILFLFESGMLGICASVLGWVIGFASMVLIAGTSKGWDIVATMSAVDVLKTFGWSVAIGMILTLCATIAPAWRASKMPAAMALRSEI